MGTLRKILTIFFALLLVFSLGTLGFIVYQYMSSSAQYKDISNRALNSELLEAQASQGSDYDPLMAYIDWNALRDINPDTVGWVYIPDSNVNYPIVHASDNSKYLHASYADSVQGLVWHGAPFLDKDNAPDFTDDNNIVYAHNMQDGSMFADVTKFQNQEYYDSHTEIYVYTPGMNYLYKPYAVNQIPGSDPLVIDNFASDAEMHEYALDKVSASNVSDTDASSQIEKSSSYLALVTCVNSLSLDERVVLFASLEKSAVPTRVADATLSGEGDVVSSGEGDVASSREGDVGKIEGFETVTEPSIESSVS